MKNYWDGKGSESLGSIMKHDKQKMNENQKVWCPWKTSLEIFLNISEKILFVLEAENDYRAF